VRQGGFHDSANAARRGSGNVSKGIFQSQVAFATVEEFSRAVFANIFLLGFH
jgi:hypothetical protein